MWEVGTGRLVRSWDLRVEGGGIVTNVTFNPNPNHHVLLAAIGTECYIISTGVGNKEDSELTSALLSSVSSGGVGGSTEKVKKAVKWEKAGEGKDGKKTVSKFAEADGVVAKLSLNGTISAEGVKWHQKGDYFLTLTPSTGASSVLIHQLSKGSSQQPFGKKREVSAVEFHVSKPFLFVAGGNIVRIYHLVKQKMVKKLYPNCKYITSVSLHGSGDHLILGTLDRKFVWFDLDLSDRPYKTMKYSEKAIRGVEFSRKYPLMASCADDGNVNVFHATVYDDLMRNPLIVPVKVLRAHDTVGRLGATAIAWHPRLPWIFTAGADGQVVLWQDV
jgi:ribosome biogenesis protein ERB1